MPVGMREMVEVSVAVLTAPDPQEALVRMVEALVRALRLRAAIVRLLGEDDDGLLRVVASHGLSEKYLAKGSVSIRAGSLDERVLAGETVENADVTQDPAFQYPERAREEGLRTMIAVPVRIHGVPRGVLRAYRAGPEGFTEDERGLLTAVAHLAGEAFERTRRTAAIERIEKDLASTLDIKEVIGRLMKHAVEGLQFSAAAIRIIDDDGGLPLVGVRGLSKRYLKAGERRADSALSQRVLAGETVVVEDLRKEPGLPLADAALAEGIRSVVSVPLVSRGRVLGLLRGYSRRVRTYDATDLRFMRLVADLGALALDNARLHRALEERIEQLGTESAGWYRFLTLG